MSLIPLRLIACAIFSQRKAPTSDQNLFLVHQDSERSFKLKQHQGFRMNCLHTLQLAKPAALRSSPVRDRSTLRRHSRISRGISWSPSNPLKENLTWVNAWSPGSLCGLTAARSSFLTRSAGSGTNGRTGFLLVLPNSLGIETFMVEQIQSKKFVLQHDNLWFDIKMHCAKSYRPFGLFVNENFKLWNEAKMNATFESRRMKPRWMQHWERFGSRSLGAVLSLLSWTMLLRAESACQSCALLWLW